VKHLYYIRHGQSQANVDMTWGGDTPLTTLGIDQAIAAGIKAAAKQFMPDIILVSPLQRAQKTAQLVAEGIGYPPDKIVTDAGLHERDMGKVTGTPFGDSGPGSSNYHLMDDIDTVESYADLQVRAKAYYEEINKRPEDTILLVGHAAFGRALKRVLTNRPYTDEYELEYAPIPNAEIFKLI